MKLKESKQMILKFAKWRSIDISLSEKKGCCSSFLIELSKLHTAIHHCTCLHFWCELTQALWCNSIVWSLFFFMK